jgi:hypothetical protein
VTIRSAADCLQRTMNAMVRAALGLRAHSGWAALVAIAGPARSPDVILRRRVELVDKGTSRSAQPYHAAAEMEPTAGSELIIRALASAQTLATDALREVIADLGRRGYETAGCGILSASGRLLPDLAKILSSHALIHTAEGELFRQALAFASEHCGLVPVRIPEKELLSAVEGRLGLSEDQLKRHLAELGCRIGPPWRQDEKHATLIAALALNAAKG